MVINILIAVVIAVTVVLTYLAANSTFWLFILVAWAVTVPVIVGKVIMSALEVLDIKLDRITELLNYKEED